jgi:uncharacterized membrane protein
MSEEEPPRGLSGRLRDNIGIIEERRRAEENEATPATRLAHGIGSFAGSLLFLAIHAFLLSLWTLANFGLLRGVPRFDPHFDGLGTIASVEAIFLSTFVLISQKRLGEADKRRADLDLHINLLAEHELTRLATLTERLAAKLGVAIDDPEFDEVKRDVEPDQVLDRLDEARRTKE